MAVKRSKYRMNVYRTRKYIVFQRIWICEEEQKGMYLYSRDMYFRRTKKRDRKYAARFGKQQADGKRIYVGKASEKEYVD